jgi:ADP-heptose:LPS heptosyltransferase
MGDPPWSGIAHNCDFPHASPDRDLMHTIDRQAEQLAMAGIADTPPADLSWMTADIARFGLPLRYALLVAGGAPHRPFKRWPAECFAAIARHMAGLGIVPVLLGTADDEEPIRIIAGACRMARSLCGQTSFADIAVLARHAVGAVGNDTGPMHLIAAAGCPAVVLFSSESDPALCAPRGAVAVLRQDDLGTLSVDAVLAALSDGPARLREPPVAA